MDDFGGRTDDDLFADEFEPVAAQPQPTPETTHHEPVDASSQQQDTKAQSQPEAPAVAAPPASSAPPSAPTAPRGLGQSRHAHSKLEPVQAPAPKAPRAPRQRHPKKQQAPVANNDSPTATPSEPVTSTDLTTAETTAPTTADEPNTTDTAEATPQPTPPTGPSAAPNAPRTGVEKAADREARLKSGANPRTKLTDAELSTKMAQMRILAAEKTRRFEKAQLDESEHAVAYARGMEEARKRRAEEAEKRKRGEEERRRMDDEREKNRERKLAALGNREGGWDLGRDHEEVEEEQRPFRSAHGGVRGARNVAGLSGSRFAHAGDEQMDGRLDGRRETGGDRDGKRDFGGERGGRGRGRGRGGRGGRGGLFDERAGEDRGQGNGYSGYNGPSRAQPASKPPVVDEFPALPPSKKVDAPAKAAPPLQLDALPPMSPQVGGWDDEMAAMDAKQDA